MSDKQFAALVKKLIKGDFDTEEVKAWQSYIAPAFQEIATAVHKAEKIHRAPIELIEALVEAKFDAISTLKGKYRTSGRSASPLPVIAEIKIGPVGKQWLLRAYYDSIKKEAPVVVYIRKNLKERKKKKSS